MKNSKIVIPAEDPVADYLKWLEKFIPEKAFFKGRSYKLVKKTLDYLFIVITIPLWVPLLLLSSLLVKIEAPRGPVFFKQCRTGKHGKRFRMYKFRTMVPNAEELKREISHLNELEWPDFKITNDPRITPVGRFLRKTSLDELPQILNVLKGQMSLVGPRPTSFSAKTYSLWHTERLDVSPGITGLWQVVARGSADFDTRMRLDIAYIDHRCIWLDIHILMRTFTGLFDQRGIY